MPDYSILICLGIYAALGMSVNQSMFNSSEPQLCAVQAGQALNATMTGKEC